MTKSHEIFQHILNRTLTFSTKQRIETFDNGAKLR